ncbi:adenosylcobinamide amidohydrolase [Paenibacillus sedimenti]|uniref:Adenosylcobinamide amidohydrolase n=1 Tax=Paenibacillus sedimenti TaxID=2770274 RepID=A0A926QK16_9BACL|nr:adenosylcobinamide amidohydrolase [Paenibacillus sedimenti]MBD0381012.1 adenosylcobinamide amidohydrolase [Paenibacillus sedimenti]
MQIQGITMERIVSQQGEYMLIKSKTPLKTLNSSPCGGGFGTYTGLMNRQVNKHYNESDPIAEMNKFILSEGLDPSETAGMLTAAKVRDVGTSSLSWVTDDLEAGDPLREKLQVTAWVTVGLGNKARAGARLSASSLFPGTINSIVVINGCLTDAAMVNAVITATEAKVAALQDMDVQVDGLPATGTTTDAVLIAATGRGRLYKYAGTATQLGYLIGRTVYDATVASGRLYGKKPY